MILRFFKLLRIVRIDTGIITEPCPRRDGKFLIFINCFTIKNQGT